MDQIKVDRKCRKFTRQDATDLEDDKISHLISEENTDKAKHIKLKRQCHSEESTREKTRNKLQSRSLQEYGDQSTTKTVLLVREKSCSLIEVDAYLATISTGQNTGVGKNHRRPRLQIQLTRVKKRQGNAVQSPVYIIFILVILGIGICWFGFMDLDKQTAGGNIVKTKNVTKALMMI